MQPLAWVGTYGYGLVTVLLASLPATLLLVKGRRRWRGPVLAAAGTVLLVAMGALRLALVVPPADTGIRLRLVQADIPQDLKWDADKEALWLRRHVELSERPATPPPDLVIWPESAVPYPLEQEPDRPRLRREGGTGRRLSAHRRRPLRPRRQASNRQ